MTRAWSDDDLDGAPALMRESLGDGRIPRTEAFFRWKHLDNPAGRSIGLVVDDGGGAGGR